MVCRHGGGPQKDREVRICVDLKPLNANILRKVHALPAVDETLAQLTGAAIFSKLDANSGFWQIPLSAASRPLTTFITPLDALTWHNERTRTFSRMTFWYLARQRQSMTRGYLLYYSRFRRQASP